VTDSDTLQSSCSALDPMLIKVMTDSLGSLEDAFILNSEDYKPFSINIVSPHHPEYRPFFWNRGNEYGRNHTYYEALCHALPTREVLESPSARYYNSSQGKPLLTQHPPCTVQVTAFVEAVRKINGQFLNELSSALKTMVSSTPEEPDVVPEDMVKEFVDGAFRNVAIQIHYNAPSHDRAMLYHMDHVFSSLHMAVTLNGRRTVGFALVQSIRSDLNREIALDMQAGDVYVTTPSAILHGVSVEELNADDRSLALQCRTLLGPKATNYWAKRVVPLCVEISKLLARFPLRIPTYAEWEEQYKLLQASLVPPQEKMYLVTQDSRE
jgi:hypothetical protein